MNELMGDIVYEPDYPETPYGALCEFFGSLETSESESDKNDEVTIEKMKEVRSRTSRDLRM